MAFPLAARSPIPIGGGGQDMRSMQEKSDGLFPFSKIRKGQREFLNDARQAIREGKHLLAHAPTGIGKTAVALTASLEYSLEKGLLVFFLTSKQSQHRIAIETLQRMKDQGGEIAAIDIISKQAMCPLPEVLKLHRAFQEFCNLKVKTKSCSYNNRSSEGIAKIVRERIMHVQDLMELCRIYGTCPHKTALEAARKGDIIVCDYNYLFSDISERVLGRIDRELEDLIIVVDEAHNLPDRIRSNLSSDLSLMDLKIGAKEAKEVHPEVSNFLLRLSRNLKELFQGLKGERRIDGKVLVEAVESSLMGGSASFSSYEDSIEAITEAGEKLVKGGRNTILLDIASFLRNWKAYEEAIARVIMNKEEAKISYKLLDPSIISKEVFDSVHSSILMSGTLYPGEVYADLLGIGEDRRLVRSYQSPFPRENRLILVTPKLTTLYHERDTRMFQGFANQISDISKEIDGNLAVFFPSYELLDKVAERLRLLPLAKKILVEKQELSKKRKDALVDELRELRERGGGILLGVQGGSLSEGVDYEDNLLQGVVIAGIPFSPPSIEVQALKEYYINKFGPEKGYEYAYVYPATNKILQAAGRCIRSEKDRAAIILMDRRLLDKRYGKFFPEDFSYSGCEDLDHEVRRFFTRGVIR